MFRNSARRRIAAISLILLSVSVFTFAYVWTDAMAGVFNNTAAEAETEYAGQPMVNESTVQGAGNLRRYGGFNVPTGSDDASPRVAAAADFDADGFKDVLVAHRDRLVFHRGNINAYAPQTQEAWEAIRDGRFVSPFESTTRSTSVPVAADFVFAGDFNRDSNLDAAFAARGGNVLYVLEGDGTGNFPNLRAIEARGTITSMATGDVNRVDGLPDLIIGTSSKAGFGLRVYAGLGDIFAAKPLSYQLPARAEAIALGQLNENEFEDIAVGTHNEVIILSGSDAAQMQDGVNPKMQSFPHPIGVKSIVTGDFLPDRAGRTELAVLSRDGTLGIFKRGVLDTEPVTRQEHLAAQALEYRAKGYSIPERISRQLSTNDLRQPAERPKGDTKTWSKADTTFAAAPEMAASPQTILTKGRVSKNAAEDLIVLDLSANRVLVLPFVNDSHKAKDQTTFTGKRETVEYAVGNQPIAVLPMRLNQDGETDLLVIERNRTDFNALVSATAASFTVNSNLDKIDANLADNICQTDVAGECTLRAAIMQTNATAGNDSIMIESGIGTITLDLGQPDNDGLGTNDEATGDLDITCVIDPDTFLCEEPLISNDNDLTITGAVGGSTIQAGTFTAYETANGPITTDRVFDIGQSGIFGGGFGGSTGIAVSMANLTIQNGNVRELTGDPNFGGNLAFGGAIRYDGFGDSAAYGSLALNNTTVNNNQADNAGGGVYHVFGSFSASGSTFSSNITNAGEGGGIYFSAATTDSDASITNSAFSNNEARQGIVFGTPVTNADGGGIRFASDLNTLTINTTNFTGNIAQEDGGAIKTLNGIATVTGGSMIGNTARRHGGGAFGDQEMAGGGRFLTVNGSTLRGNTANSDSTGGGDGGAIFGDRGTLNVTGATIGGTGAGEANTATNGGGLFNLNGILSVTNGSVNGNTALGGIGGGVGHSGSSASTISGVTVSNNTGSGILITGTGSLDASNNIITGNSGDGITKVGTGTGSHFDSNSIHSNDQLGIDLSDDGLTPNDPSDADSGPNNLQNFPVINHIRGDGTANVTLNAQNGKYRIQYYANTACDPSGHGEGEQFLTSQVVDITSGSTLTFDSPTLAFGAVNQITATATHDANGDGDFSDDGSTSEFSACRQANTPPIITALAINRQQSSAVSNSQIASVTDPNQALDTLVVTVNGGASATVNGVTVSNIAVDVSGNVTADVVANCTGDNASFTLRVTDNASDFDEATLNVTVTLNTPPTLGNYPDASVAPSGNTTVTPDAPPADNGSFSSATAAALGFSGTLSVDSITGVVTVTNANPVGNHTVTVTFTDNCGLPTEKTFTLTVNTTPTITEETLSRQQGSPSANSQIATANDDDQSEDSLTVTVNGGASATVNGVTVSNIAVAANGSVTADVAADCTAINATFTLTVTDSVGSSDTATLTVNVTPNTPPTIGTYPSTSVVTGSGTTVTPSAAPTDNGSVDSLTASATGFTGTFSADTTTGVITISNASPAGTYTVTVTAADNCGATTSSTFQLTVNTPPTITGANIMRQQGSPSINSQIAMVNDVEQSEETLTVTVNGGASATINGVTVSNIAVSPAGNVTADVVASCTAIDASFTLTVTDSFGSSADASLNVTVVPNVSPSVGNYPSANVALGGGTTVTPDAAPTDNGAIVGATASTPGFTGTFSVDPGTGVVSVTNAGPSGTYTVTVTFTDNCGAETTRTFALQVNAAPTVTVAPGGACVGSNGTVNLLVSDDSTPAESVTLSVSSSNTAVVPHSNIVFGGSGANRTLQVTPVPVNHGTGNSVLTITADDGQGGISTTIITVFAAGNGSRIIDGTSGADMIFGFNGDDTLNGLAGNDLLCGGNGADTLNGGDGDDTLFGNNGNDILTGGAGADFFSGGHGRGTVTDFNSAEGDTTDGQ